MLDSLSPAQILLVSRLIADAASAVELPAGGHDTEAFTLSVSQGRLDANPAETYTGTVAVPWLEAMVVGLQRAGFQREGILDIILDGATTCLEGGHKVTYKDTLAYVTQGKKDLQAKLKAEKGMQKTRKGKVFIRAGEVTADSE